MVTVMEELRQNDPEVTGIRIPLTWETSDAEVAQALQQNPFITDHFFVRGRRGLSASRLEFFAACDRDACQSRNSGIA